MALLLFQERCTMGVEAPKKLSNGRIAMANICDQCVVIVAEDDAAMTEVLKAMCENVLKGIVGESYFRRDEVEAAGDDMDALYELMRQCNDRMNLLCFFAKEPDCRTESGYMSWMVDHINDHPLISFDIGVKWSASGDPYSFCSTLDKKRYGFSIVCSGEAYEWECAEADGKYYDAAEFVEEVNKAKASKQPKTLSAIAHKKALSSAMTDIYECYINEEWD